MIGKPKRPNDDDGRVVANMNIEGMPGYRRDRPSDREETPAPPPLTRREFFRLLCNGVLAALAIGAVFLIIGFLFILFCTEVWFR